MKVVKHAAWFMVAAVFVAADLPSDAWASSLDDLFVAGLAGQNLTATAGQSATSGLFGQWAQQGCLDLAGCCDGSSLPAQRL
jgi:hypothetical protein